VLTTAPFTNGWTKPRAYEHRYGRIPQEEHRHQPMSMMRVEILGPGWLYVTYLKFSAHSETARLYPARPMHGIIMTSGVFSLDFGTFGTYFSSWGSIRRKQDISIYNNLIVESYRLISRPFNNHILCSCVQPQLLSFSPPLLPPGDLFSSRLDAAEGWILLSHVRHLFLFSASEPGI